MMRVEAYRDSAHPEIPFSGMWVSSSLFQDEALTGLHALIIVAILNYSSYPSPDDGIYWCYANDTFISRLLHLPKAKVSRIIKELIVNDYLHVEFYGRNRLIRLTSKARHLAV